MEHDGLGRERRTQVGIDFGVGGGGGGLSRH